METDLIAWLRNHLPASPCLRLGIGDDAAIVALGESADCVVTVDLMTEGVDFCLNEVDPRRVGHKALAINLSDLAAMAAQPVAAVVALALPRDGGLELAKELYEGMLPLAERYGSALAGGDTNAWDGPLVIAITALGRLTDRGPLLRSGATPGDRVVVTGEFGGSILGHHLDFLPRVEEAQRLQRDFALHAGIDVSDGLALDLHRVAEASGCGAVIHANEVPIAAAASQLAQSKADGSTALDHALGDGEDFELLLAVPPLDADRMIHEQTLDVRLTAIGEFVAERGLWIEMPDGARRPLEPMGFEHRFS